MADTKPDVQLSGVEYQDLYAATGIPVGTKLIILNKTTAYVRVILSATKPSSESVDGWLLEFEGPSRAVTIDTGEAGCFAMGRGPLNVQQG